MKRSFYLLLSITAVSMFGISSMSLAGSREDKQAAEPKITMKDARHIVLFANPGCAVEKCELVNGPGHPNWAVSIVKAGAQAATQIQVDGVTGKIIP